MTVRVDPASPQLFRRLVEDRFGLRFDDSKLGFLGDLLRRRATARGLPVAAYLAQVEDDAAEAGLLAEELTVGETYFFRNGDQLRAFSEAVVPEIVRMRGSGRQLSLLSAGCSSGEEPFSIAMLLSDIVPSPPWNISIQAIDLNPAALRKAMSGRFGNWALRETPADMQQRWFSRHGRDLLLSADLRALVSFDRQNLADAESAIWRPGTYDVIFCRNVIMYFTPKVQEEVIARIAASLVPGGYLFLGHAETLRGLSHEFHLVHTHNSFYYRRRLPGERLPARPATVVADARRPEAAAMLADEPDTSWFEAIDRSSRRIEALVKPASAKRATAAPQWSLTTALDLLQRERFAEALELIDKMPAAAGQDPDVMLLQALLLVQHGKLTAAGKVCRALLGQDELNAGANYVLALCREGEGDGAAALHHYGVASYLDPLFAMPLLRRGLLARLSGDREAARRDLEQALELLKREDTSRLLLFGGGFTRGALSRLCESELRACEVTG